MVVDLTDMAPIVADPMDMGPMDMDLTVVGPMAVAVGGDEWVNGDRAAM